MGDRGSLRFFEDWLSVEGSAPDKRGMETTTKTHPTPITTTPEERAAIRRHYGYTKAPAKRDTTSPTTPEEVASRRAFLDGLFGEGWRERL